MGGVWMGRVGEGWVFGWERWGVEGMGGEFEGEMGGGGGKRRVRRGGRRKERRMMGGEWV